MERQPEQREAADGEKSKMVIRFRVWDALEAADAVLFPRPCHHRIPNCKGSAVACRRLLELPELRSATVVKVHPSIGAAALRSALLMAGKTVLVPPYPGERFLYLRLHRSLVRSRSLVGAGDKRDYLRWAVPLSLEELPKIDVVIVATCVVAPNGVRLGKGKGYGEVEWGILSELGLVDCSTPVLTICHDLQVATSDELPATLMAEHDLPVDVIATPSVLLRCSSLAKPCGIRWELVGPELEQEIGALSALRELGADGVERCRAAAQVSRHTGDWCSAPDLLDEAWEAIVSACVAHFAQTVDSQPASAPRVPRRGGRRRHS